MGGRLLGCDTILQGKTVTGELFFQSNGIQVDGLSPTVHIALLSRNGDPRKLTLNSAV